MRILSGTLSILLFIGLAFGSIYFSLIQPNMNMLLLGTAVACIVLFVATVVRKRKNRY